MTVATVKKWADFQHYKNRCPPWIKLQKSILDDFEFACLPLASKALAPLLWLLASESMDGSVRIDPEWLAFRLRFTTADIEAGIKPLIDKGFLIVASDALAPRLQDACLEGEGEGETEGDISTTNVVEGEIFDSTPAAPPPKVPKRELVPVQQIVDLYHETLPMLRHVEKITSTRRGYVKQRWADDLPTLTAWRNYFTDVRASKFLTGQMPGRDGKPPFRADFEWLCRPGNFAKVAEGKYHQ